MEFWAIAYKYQEDVFWDFEKDDSTLDLSETCLLPTKPMAEDFIEDELGNVFVPVKITIDRVEKNGVWSYSRGIVEDWDEQ